MAGHGYNHHDSRVLPSESTGMLYLQPDAQPSPTFVITRCFFIQVCMAMSAGYHTFCCHSKDFYHCWLSYDLCGISFSLLAIYTTGIYYAFWCQDVSHYAVQPKLRRFSAAIEQPPFGVGSLGITLFVACSHSIKEKVGRGKSLFGGFLTLKESSEDTFLPVHNNQNSDYLVLFY